MKKLLYIFSMLFFVLTGGISCQQLIDVEIANTTQQIVIEANLTDQKGTQTVKISNSVPYNNTNVFPTVSGASVTITSRLGTMYKFTETQPGTYTINNVRGSNGDSYTCNVAVNGKTYQASSDMPGIVILDSIGVIGQVFGSKTVKTVTVSYNDPGITTNQYRYVMYVNGVQVKRIFTDDDRLTNGRRVTSALYQQDIELKTGDKVDVEMQGIDAYIYNYWFSLSSQNGNTPADSSTPSNPQSNFNNNALGYFSAHTTQRKSVIIP
jgi:hypothetical protein